MTVKWQIKQTGGVSLLESDVLAVAQKAGASAFSIHVSAPMVSVLGSGFAVPDGIVTAKHVLAPVIVRGTGDTLPGTVIRARVLASQRYEATYAKFVARDYDVAFLAIPEGIAPIPWGDSSALRVGQEMIVLGAPDTLGDSFIAYASAGRVLDLSTVVPDLFRYSVPVQPGSSGGPVLILDDGGQAVGINLLQERQGDNVVGVGLKSDAVRAVLSGEIRPRAFPVLFPEGATGTDMVIVGGAAGVVLYLLRAVFG